MGVEIRTARPDDLTGILSVLQDLPVTTGETEAFEVDASRAAGVLERILAARGRTLLVADDDGEIVGTLDLVVVENLTHDLSPWAMVENVVVREEGRRQGIGRALVDRALEVARDAGCYKVQLLSFKERAAAHEFYRSLGFESLAEGFRLYF